jgi:hypothetical protein
VNRVAAQQVGVGHPLAAVDLGPVVHAARLGPALLRHGRGAAVHLEEERAGIVATRLVAVNIGTHVGVDAAHGRLAAGRTAQQPAEELDRVAAHVHRHPAAAAAHVPEPGGVWTVVLLRLLHQVDPAQRPLIDELLEADVLGREAQLLGVHELDLGLAAGVDHAVGLGEIKAEGLLADDVLAGRGRSHGGVAV